MRERERDASMYCSYYMSCRLSQEAMNNAREMLGRTTTKHILGFVLSRTPLCSRRRCRATSSDCPPPNGSCWCASIRRAPAAWPTRQKLLDLQGTTLNRTEWVSGTNGSASAQWDEAEAEAADGAAGGECAVGVRVQVRVRVRERTIQWEKPRSTTHVCMRRRSRSVRCLA